MRSAGLVLGQTAMTAGVVLACYFLGIGLGAAAARRIHCSPVRCYAGLALGAAAGTLWSLAALRLLARAPAQHGLVVIGVIAAAVLPATLCLGATLPALGAALVGPAGVGQRGGLLYAVNTFGGVAGIAAAGFGLPVLVGVPGMYACAAAISAAAGCIALIVGDRERSGPSVEISASPAPATSRARLRIVAAGTGLFALALEVVWTRLYAQVLHNSVYSFAAIVLVFVVAIAAGSAGTAWLLRYVTSTRYAALALLGAAAATLGGARMFVHATEGLAYVGMESGMGEYVARIVGLAAATAGPAALASGAVLPALWAAWGRSEGAARPLGDLSAANTLGGIVGALGAGFLAIPEIGVRTTLLVAAVGYVVLADIITSVPSRLRASSYAVLVGVAVWNPMQAPLVHLTAGADVLRATFEGPSGIVTVVDHDGDLQLRLDNFYVLGGTAAAANERRLGLVPLLVHPAPRNVAFVGAATGITASAAPALDVDQTLVIELVPEVVAAARDFFGPWNGGLFDRQNVRVVVDDGRRYLAAHPARFDVIVSDLFIPWHPGTGALYARETYETIAQRLAAGGLFCQWLPLYQMTRDEFDIVTHTFLTVFPDATLWRADFYPNRPVVGLVGRLQKGHVDLEAVRERLARLPAWGRDALLATPRGLPMLYLGDLHQVEDLFAAAPLNTYDTPIIEFLAPRLTRMNARGDKDWFAGEALGTFADTLFARGAASPDRVFGPSAAAAAAQRAGFLLYQYALAAARHDDAVAAELQAEVSALVPDVVGAAEQPESIAGLAEAQRTLTRLRSEQARVREELQAMERRLGELGGSRAERP
jgi:spermidine synthase